MNILYTVFYLSIENLARGVRIIQRGFMHAVWPVQLPEAFSDSVKQDVIIVVVNGRRLVDGLGHNKIFSL